MITHDHLDNWFSHHTPLGADETAYDAIRKACRAAAEVIIANTPPSADQTAAVRKLREASMTACAARACGGR